MIAAGRIPTGGMHLHTQAATTLRAETRRIEFAPTFSVRMPCALRSTPTTELVGRHANTLMPTRS
jgi:hypothetical protein